MLLVIILLVIAVLILLALLMLQRRTIHHQEEQMRRIIPAYVSATLALTVAQETTRFILALVPRPNQDASDDELDEHVTQALHLVHETPRFAPVVPLHGRTH